MMFLSKEEALSIRALQTEQTIVEPWDPKVGERIIPTMPTCKIKWVNELGHVTPDENEAVGEAWIIPHLEYGSTYINGMHAYKESQHYPICAEHAKLIRGEKYRYWKFVPYANEGASHEVD